MASSALSAATKGLSDLEVELGADLASPTGSRVLISPSAVTASALSVDEVAEELRVRRGEIADANLMLYAQDQAQQLRILKAFAFIGAFDTSEALRLRALHTGEKKQAMQRTARAERRARTRAAQAQPTDPEAKRLCADFESWLVEEAHRAVLTSHHLERVAVKERRNTDLGEPSSVTRASTTLSGRASIARISDSIRSDPHKWRHAALVFCWSLGFVIYIAKDLVKIRSLYPTIKPDTTVLLERFFVASAVAYTNRTCSPISALHMACVDDDGAAVSDCAGVEVEVPPLFYVLSTIQLLTYVCGIGVLYSFVHNNVDGMTLRAVFRSGHVRAILLQLFILLAHRAVQLATNMPFLGGWYFFMTFNVLVYVAAIVLILAMDAAHEKHPITRRILCVLALLATLANLIDHLLLESPLETVDAVAFFQFCGSDGGYFKPLLLSEIHQNVDMSLLFTLVTAFRKVVRYPEKVCFVPFHFDLREVEALLAKMASESKNNKKSRLQRCCGVGNKNERVSVGD